MQVEYIRLLFWEKVQIMKLSFDPSLCRKKQLLWTYSTIHGIYVIWAKMDSETTN